MKQSVFIDPEPRRWSLRERPPFVEAYPTFSVGGANRELKQGRDHVIWRDRALNVAGVARARWATDNRLVVRYRIEEQSYFDAEDGELALEVTWKGSRLDNRRPFATCPVCRRHVDVLVFAGTWLCANIHHGLRHRTACVSKEVRWSEALADVQGALAAEDALGLAGKAQRARIEQRDALLVRLNGRPVTASALKLAIISAEWVKPVSAAEAG